MPRLKLPERLRPRSKAGKAGVIAGGVVAGLIALDVLAIVATAVFAATAASR